MSPTDTDRPRPARGVRRRAAGFALLAVLGLLIAGAAATVLLSGAGHGGRARGPVAVRGALADLDRLAAARDALLAYSTIYPGLYGPTGAGPGHLPCPDTDDTFRLAGPNPPCGRGGIVDGWLPAHVSVGTLRTGIDLDPAEASGVRVRYRLVTRAANNPARRPLSIGAEGAVDALADPGAIAGLSLPGRGGAPPVTLYLDARALDAAAERRVAAWIVARAALPVPDADMDTDAGAPDALALVTRRAKSTIGGEGGLALVDGVPQARHWFALDGWSRRFDVRVDPRCREAAFPCAWRIERGERETTGIALAPSGPAPGGADAPVRLPGAEPGA